MPKQEQTNSNLTSSSSWFSLSSYTNSISNSNLITSSISTARYYLGNEETIFTMSDNNKEFINNNSKHMDSEEINLSVNFINKCFNELSSDEGYLRRLNSTNNLKDIPRSNIIFSKKIEYNKIRDFYSHYNISLQENIELADNIASVVEKNNEERIKALSEYLQKCLHQGGFLNIGGTGATIVVSSIDSEIKELFRVAEIITNEGSIDIVEKFFYGNKIENNNEQYSFEEIMQNSSLKFYSKIRIYLDENMKLKLSLIDFFVSTKDKNTINQLKMMQNNLLISDTYSKIKKYLIDNSIFKTTKSMPEELLLSKDDFDILINKCTYDTINHQTERPLPLEEEFELLDDSSDDNKPKI